MAGIYFSQTRNVELSTLTYLETQIDASWTGITTVKTFKSAYDKNVPVPIVCARLADTNNARLEIGADTLDNRYVFMIDIFARSAAQRMDIADFITNKLKDGWTYNTYAHESGDSSTIVATAAGRSIVTDWTDNRLIELGENVDIKDRFRHIISIQVRQETTS